LIRVRSWSSGCFAGARQSFELMTVYLGDRLGLYRALRDGGPATAPELAARAGTAQRYALEWLEGQAASGFLTVDEVKPIRGSPSRDTTWTLLRSIWRAETQRRRAWTTGSPSPYTTWRNRSGRPLPSGDHN
jgi:hypothetical protein